MAPLAFVQVELDNISMTYQTPVSETRAIEDISLQVSQGEFVTVVGPSGCGKSTLLDIMCGLVKPTWGEVKVYSPVGYMLQRDHLFEWLSIRKNCLLGPEVQGQNLKEARAYVDYLLNTYGLGDFAEYYPRQLSGGMRQRAALIRTLAVKPEVLLLDEPFSALDYQTRLAVVDDVWSIVRREGKTAVFVTHDIAEAISMSDRIIVLTSRPSTVKSIHNIAMDKKLNPLQRRQEESFRRYFDIIWKELDVHVERD